MGKIENKIRELMADHKEVIDKIRELSSEDESFDLKITELSKELTDIRARITFLETVLSLGEKGSAFADKALATVDSISATSQSAVKSILEKTKGLFNTLGSQIENVFKEEEVKKEVSAEEEQLLKDYAVIKSMLLAGRTTTAFDYVKHIAAGDTVIPEDKIAGYLLCIGVLLASCYGDAAFYLFKDLVGAI